MARDLVEIREELVSLLGISPGEAELYVEAISGARIGPETLGDPGKKKVVDSLKARGMLIRAGSKEEEFIPVHPRLALSNLFRTYSDEKAAGERKKERRLSVDRLTLELVPIYEKTKNPNATSGRGGKRRE